MSKLEDLYARKSKIDQEIKALKARISKLEQEKARQKPPVGLVKALRENLSILQELANRYEVATVDRTEPGPAISNPGAVFSHVKEMGDLAQEQMRVLLLDSRNRLLGSQVVYQGSIDTCAIRQAEIFRQAIIVNAPNIVVVHNHPSGDPEPSTNDVKVTEELLRTGKLLGIYVLDHIIGGHNLFVSLKERTATNPEWGLNWSK